MKDIAKALVLQALFISVIEKSVCGRPSPITVPIFSKRDDDSIYRRYFINMTFGTYPATKWQEWKSHGAIQITTMDDRSELFVAEQACETGCDITFPNIYDRFNSTTRRWYDNSTQ